MVDLMQRIREGSGPDRVLDADIHTLLIGSKDKPIPKHYGVEHPGTHLGRYEYSEGMGGVPVSQAVPAYTASVDLWLALARERGWNLEVDAWGLARLYTESVLGWHVIHKALPPVAVVRHDDPARACALAMMEALGHE